MRHGGLSPSLKLLKNIEEIQRPIGANHLEITGGKFSYCQINPQRMISLPNFDQFFANQETGVGQDISETEGFNSPKSLLWVVAHREFY